MNRTLLATTAGITLGAGLLLPAARADAHDFTPTADTAICVELNGQPIKQITVTVTNNYDLSATVASARASTTVGTLPAGNGATMAYTLRNAAVATGTSAESVAVTWTDGFRQVHPVTLVWGEVPCVTADEPTPTPNTAPPAEPPATSSTTVVPEAPTTTTTEAPKVAPVVPPTNPPAPASVTIPATLPATGPGDVLLTIAIIGAGLVVLGLFIWLATLVARWVDHRTEQTDR